MSGRPEDRAGDALRALRRAAGMTLQDVADSAGVSLSYLSRVENADVHASWPWTRRVAVAIGTRLADQAEKVAA